MRSRVCHVRTPEGFWELDIDTRVMCDIVAAERAKVGASLDALIIATQKCKDGIDAKQPWGG